MISGEGPNCINKFRNLLAIGNNCNGRVAKCKEWTKEAIPKIVLEKTGKPATPEFIDGATKTLGFWWLGTLEQIKQGR